MNEPPRYNRERTVILSTVISHTSIVHTHTHSHTLLSQLPQPLCPPHLRTFGQSDCDVIAKVTGACYIPEAAESGGQRRPAEASVGAQAKLGWQHSQCPLTTDSTPIAGVEDLLIRCTQGQNMLSFSWCNSRCVVCSRFVVELTLELSKSYISQDKR